MNKILVTGSAGFIGSALTINLLNRGNKVLGIDNHNDYYEISLKEDRLKRYANHPNYSHLRIDLCDNKSIEDAFTKFKPACVVNLAAQAGVRNSIINPLSYINSNIVGFNNILESSKKIDIKNLVYASSSSVYGGNTNIPFTEDQQVNHPLNLYAATKKSNELMAHSFSHIHGIPATGLRFFTVYGPWGRPDMAPMIFAKNILSRKPISIFNFGRMSRDFTFISDIVEGTYLCCLKPPIDTDSTSSKQHKVFNIGNGKPVDLLNFIEILEDSFKIKSIKSFEELQPGDVEKTWADTKSLFNWIGYEPKVKIEEGIPLFVKWYLSYFM